MRVSQGSTFGGGSISVRRATVWPFSRGVRNASLRCAAVLGTAGIATGFLAAPAQAVPRPAGHTATRPAVTGTGTDGSAAGHAVRAVHPVPYVRRLPHDNRPRTAETDTSRHPGADRQSGRVLRSAPSGPADRPGQPAPAHRADRALRSDAPPAAAEPRAAGRAAHTAGSDGADRTVAPAGADRSAGGAVPGAAARPGHGPRYLAHAVARPAVWPADAAARNSFPASGTEESMGELTTTGSPSPASASTAWFLALGSAAALGAGALLLLVRRTDVSMEGGGSDAFRPAGMPEPPGPAARTAEPHHPGRPVR
jgi:hypothetical protein